MSAVRLSITIFISEMLGQRLFLIPFGDIWSIEDTMCNYVSNFTDVDDKLIQAAKELGKDVPTISERLLMPILKMFQR